MIRKTFFILITILIFSGCAERGSIVPLKLIESHVSKHINNDQQIPKLILKSSREDKIQKNISASFIVIIGLLLIL